MIFDGEIKDAETSSFSSDIQYIYFYNPTINFRAISLATLCHVVDSYHAITPVCVNICPPMISIEKKQS